MSIAIQIERLTSENVTLRQQNKTLSEQVLYLLELLEKKTVTKDSHNSHNPPSQDKKKRKKRSLRKKSGKKTGGQKGHQGHTLNQKAIADQQTDLKSDFCSQCGDDLSGLSQELISKRQVVELPPITPIYVEYRQYGCVCNYGHHQKAACPKNVNAPIQYGSSVTALVSYLNVYQYVPYARLQELFMDVFHLPLSEGTVENLLNKAAEKSDPIYQIILEQIKEATYVGSDETGAKVNDEKWWVWVWQNAKNTFLKASKSRGFATIEALFPEGLPNAVIGSDRWAAQLKVKSNDKQLCFPHLLRDLIFLEEKEGEKQWATDFKELLKDALLLRKGADDSNEAFVLGKSVSKKIENRLNKLLAIPLDKSQFPQTATFQKSMIKNRNYLFPFLYNLEVPPDNNASERAIRNVKVKQKVSGQFKSGQDTFCVLRSIIDTLKKRQLNIMQILALIVAV